MFGQDGGAAEGDVLAGRLWLTQILFLEIYWQNFFIYDC